MSDTGLMKPNTELIKKQNAPGTVPVAANSDELKIDLAALALRLLEKWYVLFITAVVGALIAGAVTFWLITPMYQATSKLYVVSPKDSAINLSDLQIGNYLTKDYSEVFKNWAVNEAVISRLDLPYTREQAAKMVSVTNPSDTRILYITVTSPSAEEAQLMANTYAEVAQSFIAAKMDTREPTIFETALKPTKPSSPSKTKNILIGFMLGFVLAAGVVTLLFIMDDYIRSSDDIKKYVNLPTLGSVMFQEDDQADATKAKGNAGGKRGKRA